MRLTLISWLGTLAGHVGAGWCRVRDLGLRLRAARRDASAEYEVAIHTQQFSKTPKQTYHMEALLSESASTARNPTIDSPYIASYLAITSPAAAKSESQRMVSGAVSVGDIHYVSPKLHRLHNTLVTYFKTA